MSSLYLKDYSPFPVSRLSHLSRGSGYQCSVAARSMKQGIKLRNLTTEEKAHTKRMLAYTNYHAAKLS